MFKSLILFINFYLNLYKATSSMISKARLIFENNGETDLMQDETAIKKIDLAIDVSAVKTIDDVLAMNSRTNSARPSEEKQDDKKILTPYVIKVTLLEATGLPKASLLSSSDVYATLSWFPKAVVSDSSALVKPLENENLDTTSNASGIGRVKDVLESDNDISRHSHSNEQLTTLVKSAPKVYWDSHQEYFYFHGKYFNDPLENNANDIQREVNKIIIIYI